MKRNDIHFTTVKLTVTNILDLFVRISSLSEEIMVTGKL